MAKRAERLEAGNVVWFTHKGVRRVGKVERVLNNLAVVDTPDGRLKGPFEKFTVQKVAGERMNIGPIWTIQNLRRFRKIAPDALSVTVRLNGVAVFKLVSRGAGDVTFDPFSNAPALVVRSFYDFLKRWYGHDGENTLGAALEMWINYKVHGGDTDPAAFIAEQRAALELVLDSEGVA